MQGQGVSSGDRVALDRLLTSVSSLAERVKERCRLAVERGPGGAMTEREEPDSAKAASAGSGEELIAVADPAGRMRAEMERFVAAVDAKDLEGTHTYTWEFLVSV